MSRCRHEHSTHNFVLLTLSGPCLLTNQYYGCSRISPTGLPCPTSQLKLCLDISVIRTNYNSISICCTHRNINYKYDWLNRDPQYPLLMAKKARIRALQEKDVAGTAMADCLGCQKLTKVYIAGPFVSMPRMMKGEGNMP